MTSKSNIEFEIIQKNGNIVMEALHALNEPVTLQKVTNKIALLHNINPSRIKETVKIVLLTGLDNGFLQRINGRYSICGIEKMEVNSNREYIPSDSEEVGDCCPSKRQKYCLPPTCCRTSNSKPSCPKSKQSCSKPKPTGRKTRFPKIRSRKPRCAKTSGRKKRTCRKAF